jgi:hypothetical protein
LEESEINIDINIKTISVTINIYGNAGSKFVNIEKDKFSSDLKKFISDSKIFLINGQKITYKYETESSTTSCIPLILTFSNSNSDNFFLLNKDTIINLIEGSKNVILVEKNSILKMSLNLMDMGIGGLDEEFNEIFRRAFSSKQFLIWMLNIFEVFFYMDHRVVAKH